MWLFMGFTAQIRLAEEPLQCDNPTASKARENAAFTETSRRNDVLLLQILQNPAVFGRQPLSAHNCTTRSGEAQRRSTSRLLVA